MPQVLQNLNMSVRSERAQAVEGGESTNPWYVVPFPNVYSPADSWPANVTEAFEG